MKTGRRQADFWWAMFLAGLQANITNLCNHAMIGMAKSIERNDDE